MSNEKNTPKWENAPMKGNPPKFVNKESGLEWFAERIQSDKIFNFEKVLYQAKEKEKERMIEFAKTCLSKAHYSDVFTALMNIDKYYNEKYGNL